MMDWTNEEYVRVYTRETADDMDLSWEALAVWRAMLVKFDRAGIIAARNGWTSIARITRIPPEVVQRVGPELVLDGRVRQIEGGFYAPNFVPAQTASKSDRLRQRESRDRRRDEAESKPQIGDVDYKLSQPVTRQSHAVTTSHAPSQNVTLCSALLCDPSAEAMRCEDIGCPPIGDTPQLFDEFANRVDAAVGEVGAQRAKPIRTRRGKSPPEPTAEEQANVERVLSTLSRHSGVSYTGNREHTKLIVAHLRNGITVGDMQKVAGYCALELGWKGSDKMHQYLRPSTLFGPQKLYEYLDEARAWFAKLEADERAQAPVNGTLLDAEIEPDWMQSQHGDAS